MNMDAQDAQDKQDEGLLRGEPARAMIRCGLADAQEYKTTALQKSSCQFCPSM